MSELVNSWLRITCPCRFEYAPFIVRRSTASEVPVKLIMAANRSENSRLVISAYLGMESARASLGPAAPEPFGLASMIRGGDHQWRAAMLCLGHEPVAVAACALAELALEIYSIAPDSSFEVHSKASEAVDSLTEWKMAPGSPSALAAVERNAIGFSVNVSVGECLFDQAGFRGKILGRIVGKCASVVLAPDNSRYVRWFGEAVEFLFNFYGIEEDLICRTVALAFQPYLRPTVR